MELETINGTINADLSKVTLNVNLMEILYLDSTISLFFALICLKFASCAQTLDLGYGK